MYDSEQVHIQVQVRVHGNEKHVKPKTEWILLGSMNVYFGEGRGNCRP